MDFFTARKAIDYYFSLLKEGNRYNPLRKPSIGFYGGEPLLNFGLIKECVEYIKNKYNGYEVHYGMTTNGSLLDKEKATWLIKHNVSISLSLDGPEEEHNRLRIYRNGKGTFRDVMKNINSIMELGYKNISSLPVFDWKTNLFKNQEFFNRFDVPQVSNVSQVSSFEWDRYYEQFTREDRRDFMEQLKKIKKCYFRNFSNQGQKERKSYFDMLVGNVPSDDLFRGRAIDARNPLMPFTGACIPGVKLFVDVNGCIHACERINYAYPIGNVDQGLNFEKISQLIREYLYNMDKCPDCEGSRICGSCFTEFMTDKGFNTSSKICQGIESNMKSSFIETFTIAEKNPEFVEARYKHRNIKKYYGD